MSDQSGFRWDQASPREREAAEGKLLVELEESARQSKSIRPRFLGRRTLLLSCPAVLARMEEHSTPTDAAYAALQTAIATFDGDDRRIVEAVLVATSEFEGKIVEARKDHLKKRYYIGEKAYKDRRKPLLRRVIALLLEGAAESSAELHARLIADLGCLARDLGQMECITRAYLFLVAKNKAFPPNGSSDRHYLTRPLYVAYQSLIHSYHYCFGLSSSRRELFLNHFSATDMADFQTALADIFARLPFNNQTREDLYKLCSEMSNRLPAARAQLAHIQSEFWCPWALRLSFGAEKREPTDIKGIVAACQQGQALARSMGVSSTIELNWTENAVDCLGAYYRIDPRVVVLDHGRTLREWFMSYRVSGELDRWWSY